MRTTVGNATWPASRPPCRRARTAPTRAAASAASCASASPSSPSCAGSRCRRRWTSFLRCRDPAAPRLRLSLGVVLRAAAGARRSPARRCRSPAASSWARSTSRRPAAAPRCRPARSPAPARRPAAPTAAAGARARSVTQTTRRAHGESGSSIALASLSPARASSTVGGAARPGCRARSCSTRQRKADMGRVAPPAQSIAGPSAKSKRSRRAGNDAASATSSGRSAAPSGAPRRRPGAPPNASSTARDRLVGLGEACVRRHDHPAHARLRAARSP